MLDQVDAALSLWDRFKRWRHTRNNPPAESVASRFVRLFESHGVHRNQIPRFIGYDLTLKDVQDDASLLAKLDEPLLEAACEMFAVRREWLDGAEKQVYPCHDFYKHPARFAAFLRELKNNNFDADFQGVLIAPEELGDANALLILQEAIGCVGKKPIYRYHICHNWLFTYWKARAYLAACVAIAWKEDVYVHGIRLSKKEIDKLAEGETLLGWQGEGIWELGYATWHPEDMALKPDTFLKNVDSEIDNFGIKSALKLWLDLDENGLMDTGMGADFSVKAKQLFRQESEKY